LKQDPVCDVTFVVPLYQSVATVRETVESILADLDASKVSGEIVVVNDGSTDAGPAIVDQFVRRDFRVRLIHRDNGGLAAARNTGLAHARGRSVRFLDADDLALPGGTARLLAAAETSGAACGGQELIDESGAPMGREISPRSGSGAMVGLEQLITGNAMGVGAVLLSRTALGDRRFDESLPVCEDWDLWLRLAAGPSAVRFAAIPNSQPAVKQYRVRAGSLSKRFTVMNEVGARVLRKLESEWPTEAAAAGGVERGLLGLATGYATMQAVMGDMDAALRMLAPFAPRPLASDQLASDACAAVLLGLGIRPDERGASRDRWLAPLSRWWAELESRGWADGTTMPAAWHEVARLTVAPAAVARACVDRAVREGATSLVVAGFGKNGRRLAAELDQREQPLPWTIRDDALGAARGPALPAPLEPMRARIHPDDAVVITPERDEALVSALVSVGVTRLVRWKHELADLAAAERANLSPTTSADASSGRQQLRCA
jgi:hypothetical protein